MHFVKKVPTTEEERAVIEKTRAIKIQKYLAARDVIFGKVVKDEKDVELLRLTYPVLAKHPDNATFWTLRRESIERLIKTLKEYSPESDEDLRKHENDAQQTIKNTLDTELALTYEALIEANPKCYGAWHHRGWTMRKYIEQELKADFKRELELCKKALTLDCRNFHCWDYRRLVSKLAKSTNEEELEFSLDRINHNFSNYSAWHYRSVLLPKVQNDKTGSPKLDAETLKSEVERVAQAFFCDANDQSGFVYARWLLSLDSSKTFLHAGSPEPPVPLSITFNGIHSTIVMTKAAGIDEISKFLKNTQRELFTAHSSLTIKANTAFVWTYNSPAPLFARLHEGADWIQLDASKPLFRRDLLKLVFDCDSERPRSIVVETLKQILEELMTLPPISAWTQYTYALCLLEEDPAKYHDKVAEIFSILANNYDKFRKELYMSLRSRILLNKTLREEKDGKQLLDRILDGEESSLVLKPDQINSLHGIEFLAGFLKDLTISGNMLPNLDDLLLPNLERLTVNENPIERISSLHSLKQLEYLNIAATPVSVESVLPGLRSLPNLNKLIFCETTLVNDFQELSDGLHKEDITFIRHWLH